MAGPLEQFEVHPIQTITVAGVDLSFTNASAFMAAAVVLVTGFVIAGTMRPQMVPGRWQAMVELMYEFVAGIVKDNIGPRGRAYFPFIFSLFMFILACNLMGLFPYAFTVTSHLAVTAAFAGLVFLAVIVIGLINHGLHFFSLFLPPGTPWYLAPLIILIEIISFLSRPVTHAIRLFANMTAGHILLKVFAGFIVSLGAAGGALAALGILPFAMIIAISALELLVAAVQAYVFALLTCVYLNDAINLSH